MLEDLLADDERDSEPDPDSEILSWLDDDGIGLAVETLKSEAAGKEVGIAEAEWLSDADADTEADTELESMA